MHTAVISIADLLPSMKLLNIFGLIEPRSSMCRYLSRMSHTVSGVDAVIMRLVARALAGGHDLEAAGARPVDMLADERRLIAPGEAVDDTRGFRLRRRCSGPASASASTCHHDDVLAVRDRA